MWICKGIHRIHNSTKLIVRRYPAVLCSWKKTEIFFFFSTSELFQLHRYFFSMAEKLYQFFNYGFFISVDTTAMSVDIIQCANTSLLYGLHRIQLKFEVLVFKYDNCFQAECHSIKRIIWKFSPRKKIFRQYILLIAMTTIIGDWCFYFFFFWCRILRDANFNELFTYLGVIPNIFKD